MSLCILLQVLAKNQIFDYRKSSKEKKTKELKIFLAVHLPTKYYIVKDTFPFQICWKKRNNKKRIDNFLQTLKRFHESDKVLRCDKFSCKLQQLMIIAFGRAAVAIAIAGETFPDFQSKDHQAVSL